MRLDLSYIVHLASSNTFLFVYHASLIVQCTLHVAHDRKLIVHRVPRRVYRASRILPPLPPPPPPPPPPIVHLALYILDCASRSMDCASCGSCLVHHQEASRTYRTCIMLEYAPSQVSLHMALQDHAGFDRPVKIVHTCTWL